MNTNIIERFLCRIIMAIMVVPVCFWKFIVNRDLEHLVVFVVSPIYIFIALFCGRVVKKSAKQYSILF